MIRQKKRYRPAFLSLYARKAGRGTRVMPVDELEWMRERLRALWRLKTQSHLQPGHIRTKIPGS